MSAGWLAFALSAGLAQLMANLDNFALLLALALPLGARRAVAGYLGAQAAMLLAAFWAAEAAAGVLTGRGVGWLGAVPLALGLWGLWRQARPQGQARQEPGAAAPAMPVAGLLVMFLGLSLDSFAVITPLLAESAPPFRLAALVGAAAAALAMAGAAMLLAARLAGPGGGRGGALLARLERLGPWAMVAAGVYVLGNTATDAMP